MKKEYNKVNLFPEGIENSEVFYFVKTFEQYSNPCVNEIIWNASKALDKARSFQNENIKYQISRTILPKSSAFGSRKAIHDELTISMLEKIIEFSKDSKKLLKEKRNQSSTVIIPSKVGLK